MNTHVRSATLAVVSLLLLLAVPARASYTLSVSVQGSGTISTNPTFATYPANVTVGLTATPSTGWYFAGWSGAVTAVTNPVNVTMTGNLSETGLFLPYPTYSLTVTTNGQGSIDLSPPGGSYYSNTVVTATATAADGWEFTGWSGTNGVASALTVTVDGNVALTGTFVELPAFDVEPVGVTNAVGSTVSFVSHSVGTAPLAYQWYFGGGALAGATNATLTLTNASAGKAGFYEVIATNLYSSATSSVVALVLTNSNESTNIVSVCDEPDLRAAISAGGWVSIGCNGTITLSGTINITKNVILDGTGVSAIISGGNAVQLFYVEPGVSFAVTNLTLANGSSMVTSGTAPAAGGAIYNNGGMVTLTGCTLTNDSALSTVNGAAGEGGAICNNGGTVQIYGSSFLGNLSYNENGGNVLGGAVFNANGSMVLVNSLLQSNTCSNAYDDEGVEMGGAVYQASGALCITNCILAGNLASGGGADLINYLPGPVPLPTSGGALSVVGGTVAMDLCQLAGNTARGSPGASDNSAAGPANGGAVYCVGALMAVRCSFFGNQVSGGLNSVNTGAIGPTTASGGAIYNLGTVVLKNCLVCSNGTLGGTSYGPNEDGPGPGGNGVGGGIYNAGQFSATNCTIALNAAIAGQGTVIYSPGGIFATNGNALGGGVFNAANATFLGVNVTIASNLCNALASPPKAQPPGSAYFNGFGAGAQIANTNGTVSLLNSLLAYGSTNGNAYGVITDLGDNISSDGSANFESGTSFNFTDPLLGPLANNGGPTLTMALLSGSPAINYANSGDGAPPDDQRGYARPIGPGAIDLGAYQSGATQIYSPPPIPNVSIVAAYPNVVVSFTTSPLITNTLHFQSSTNLINWIDVQTFGVFSSPSNISETISEQGARQKFFRLSW